MNPIGPRNMNLPESEVDRRVRNTLEAVGFFGQEKKAAFQLSGGQRRSAAIASVLSMEPDILVLNEPSANLDAQARRKLIDLLKGFSHSILISTHDITITSELCPRSILMEDGRVIADAPTPDIAAPLRY